MTDSATIKGVDSEAWFLEQLDADPLPADDLIDSLRRLIERGGTGQAEARAKLLQDMLAEQGRADEALQALGLRLEEGMPPLDARAEALEVVGPDRRRQAYASEAGLEEGNVPAREAVRRLRVLIALDEGCLCYDKTWGFGVVRGNDHFEHRVEIDFEQRIGHRMAHAYAAQTLQILDGDHLLARRHREPDVIRALVTEDPAELVRLALRSFGPMPVAILQEHLSPRFVQTDDWKRFWDAARKELKKDPLVTLPGRRTEPIALRDRAEDFGVAWRTALAAERDMDTVLVRVLEWRETAGAGAADPETAAAIVERLAFVVRGSGERASARTARAVMLADTLPGGPEGVKVATWARRLASRETFLDTIRTLPAREVRPFLAWLHRHGGDAFLDALPALLPRMDATAFSEAMEMLLREGREDAAAAAVRDLVTRSEDAPEALLWLVKHPDRQEAWSVAEPIEWARLLLAALEQDQGGDRLKAQNALRERIGKPAWMGDLMARLADHHRREIVLRIRECPAWPVLERQALAGLLVKRFPELEKALAEAVSAERSPSAERPRTSARSYRERQAQLEKVVRAEIPRNSREIGVARSYGDLRENFEYKAAKEMQTILMRRQEELERSLQEVEPCTFDAPLADRVAPGCGVELAHTDGTREIHYLLGAWDRDEELHILSSESELARALLGRTAGEEVEIPSEQGARKARIAALLPLTPDVRAWIKGDA